MLLFLDQLQVHSTRNALNYSSFSELKIKYMTIKFTFGHTSVIAKHLHIGRQEDAHEFLRLLVETLAKSCLNGYGKE